MEALAERAGQLMSVQSLREDLDVAHETVSRMLDILENFYFIFRLLPYANPRIKALKKDRKLYIWDWSLVKEEGSRFENLVGSTLLKLAHFRQDYQGYRTGLCYLRDQKGKEIDFVYLEDKKPLFAAEVKLSEENFNPNLFYQVHLKSRAVEKKENGIWYRLLPYEKFCKEIGAV